MLILSDNNSCFDLRLALPLEKAAVTRVESMGKRDRIYTPLVVDETIFCPVIGALLCLDLSSLKQKWALEGGGARIKWDSGYLYTTLNHRLVCIDPKTAAVAWQSDSDNGLYDVHGEYLFAWSKQAPQLMRCRNKRTGELVWEKAVPDCEQLIFARDQFVSCGQSFHGINPQNGEILWSFGKKDWIDENILSLGLEYPDSLSDHETYMMHLGPIIDDILYVTPVVGAIAAIDIKSGLLKGTTEVPTGVVEKPQVSREIQKLIHRDGKLFFHRTGFHQDASVIFGAIDVSTADVLFTCKHFHPATAAQVGSAFMVDRYYILSFSANYLVVFDTDSREIAWEYETKTNEKNALAGMPLPYDNGLVCNDNQQHLYRFEGKSQST